MYKERSKKRIDFSCPQCGSNKLDRETRTVSEKLIYYLSFGNKASKKYKCPNCGWTVLLDKDNK